MQLQHVRIFMSRDFQNSILAGPRGQNIAQKVELISLLLYRNQTAKDAFRQKTLQSSELQYPEKYGLFQVYTLWAASLETNS